MNAAGQFDPADEYPADEDDDEALLQPSTSIGIAPRRFSLWQLLAFLTVVALGSGYVITMKRLREAETELSRLRQEVGYLEATAEDEIAAVRVVTDEPLTYRLRVRVPQSPSYRVAYSSRWSAESTSPDWYAAVSVPPGESTLIVRIAKDPRDEQWKITTLRRNEGETRRLSTVLPAEQVAVFRGSHEWLHVGISTNTLVAPSGSTIRLLDDRAMVGPGASLLYGDRPPEQDIVGVFAELQPDVGPLN